MVDVPDGAVLMGPCGTGKTHLAVAKTKELFRLGQKVRFWRAIDLIDRIKDSVLSGEYNESSVYDYYASYPHMILDDIAVLNPKPFVKATLYRIIDFKWNHQIPMIITTDKTPDELALALEDRIASRIFDRNWLKIIRLTGSDKRIAGVSGDVAM